MSENDINRILNAIGGLGENIQETNQRIDKLDTRIEEVNTNLSARIDKLDMRIEEVNTNLNNRMDKLDARIEEVNTNLSARVEEVNKKVNTRMDNLESSVNKRFDAVNARIDAHHRTKCGGNGTRKSKWEPRVEALEEQVKNHEKRIIKLEK